jgi:hypothetical protein
VRSRGVVLLGAAWVVDRFMCLFSLEACLRFTGPLVFDNFRPWFCCSAFAGPDPPVARHLVAHEGYMNKLKCEKKKQGSTVEESKGYIVRCSDVVDVCDLRGSGLQLHGCSQRPRNICRRTFADDPDLGSRHDRMHELLCSWTRRWTKAVCNSVTKLVLFETLSAIGIVRTFALLARAIFQPLHSIWFWCEAAPLTSLANPELPLPLEVYIGAARCMLCPAVVTGATATSDEVALQIVRHGPLQAAWLLDYTIIPARDLLGMLVSGKQALPLEKPQGRTTNSGLRDLKSALPSAFGASRGRGRGRGRAGRGADALSEGSRPRAHIRRTGRLDIADPDCPAFVDGVVGDEAVETMLAEHAPEDVFEIVEACCPGLMDPSELEGCPVDEIVSDTDLSSPAMPPSAASSSSGPAVHIAASSSSGPAVPPPPMPLPVPPTPVVVPTPGVVGPTGLGYFVTGALPIRSVCRITGVFGASTSIRCYLHPKCCVAFAEWKLPSSEDIKAWIASAEIPPEGATKEHKAAASQAHMNALKGIIATSTWPGRTRQGLIDEAAPTLPPV